MNKEGKPQKVYRVTDFGIRNDRPAEIQTEAIQKVIDLAASQGGGTIVFPAGHYRSGSLFFRPGTVLHLEDAAHLQGSEDMGDYELLQTRIEGETILYFAALVNADGVDNFSITGSGVIDGCGLRVWKNFWLRRRWNPDCLNVDEMRPRLVYVSNSRHVLIAGVHLHNSAYWTCHLYRCSDVELRDLDIFAPAKPVPAPSSDAIDLDNCFHVRIHHCRMEVNDDAVTLKGGKGPHADTAEDDGPNADVLVEDCFFGYCHSAFTCGSECVDNRNIVMRNCTLDGAEKMFYLKMRPDTPQINRNISLENISGSCKYIFVAASWAQFPRSREIYHSHAEKITFTHLDLTCQQFFYVLPDPAEFSLSEILFRSCRITTQENLDSVVCPEGIMLKDVEINGCKNQGLKRR